MVPICVPNAEPVVITSRTQGFLQLKMHLPMPFTVQSCFQLSADFGVPFGVPKLEPISCPFIGFLTVVPVI